MAKFLHLTKTLGLMSLVYVDWSELHLNVLQKEVVEMTKAGVTAFFICSKGFIVMIS
jgi:hypothetical protein